MTEIFKGILDGLEEMAEKENMPELKKVVQEAREDMQENSSCEIKIGVCR